MKNIKHIIRLIALSVILTFTSCEDFLEVEPFGVVTEAQLGEVDRVEGLIIAAYAGLGNTTFNWAWSSDYVWGSVRSDDAYKGGSGVADQGALNELEQYNLVIPANGGYFNNTWIGVYQCISRVNTALRQLDQFSNEDYTISGIQNAKTVREAELRFLKAHFMFILKRLFKYPVWIDHTVPIEEIRNISNDLYTNDELWGKIADEFKFAMDNLPESQPQLGRANKWAAATYLAKTKLYQAYQQNENHSVINVDQAKMQEVVSLADEVINSGRYSLVNNYGEKWTWGFENNSESIFAIQFSYDDGTTWGRVDFEHGLNYNMAPSYGCCSFHHASQNLVNAFRTDPATGLPLFNTFNVGEMSQPDDFRLPNNTVDPRLDHTIGIVSHPFKYDVGFVVQPGWSRTPAVYGNFLTMKEIQLPSSNAIRRGGAFFGTGQNWDILQYNDLLLMKAEALIELGQHELARPIINEIRQRANNSKDWITYPAGHPLAGSGFSDYNIALYDGNNLAWSQDNARLALRWERRLEFAMESPRFHDLVRWGIAAEELNAYLQVERERKPFLSSAAFTKGRDEYLPIPQVQIDLVEGLYKQNPNY